MSTYQQLHELLRKRICVWFSSTRQWKRVHSSMRARASSLRVKRVVGHKRIIWVPIKYGRKVDRSLDSISQTNEIVKSGSRVLSSCVISPDAVIYVWDLTTIVLASKTKYDLSDCFFYHIIYFERFILCQILLYFYNSWLPGVTCIIYPNLLFDRTEKEFYQYFKIEVNKFGFYCRRNNQLSGPENQGYDMNIRRFRTFSHVTPSHNHP